MAAAMKSTGDTPPLKKSTITKAHEIAKKVAEETEELEELSSDTLKSYQTKARADARSTDDDDRSRKRIRGANNAGGKVAKREMDSSYKEDLPNMLKDIRGKKKSHANMRREYGSSWKRLTNHTAAEHGHNYNRDHLLQIGQKHMNEDVEAIDEISKATMGRYINKAKDSIDLTSYRSGIKDGTAISSSKPYTSNNPLEKKLTKRHKGIETAVSKLTREESEQIDELSKKTLGSYVKKASEEGATSAYMAGTGHKRNTTDVNKDAHHKKAYKRLTGINKAATKLAKEEAENIEEISADMAHRYLKGKRERDYDISPDGTSSKLKKPQSFAKMDRDVKSSMRALKTIKKANEDVELTQEEIDFIEATMADLDEGRGRPPKEGSAAYKAKMQQDLSDMPALGVQIRKAASINKPVTFMDGKSKQISDNHINRFHDHMDSRKTSQDKSAFQKRAHKSHDEFVKAVSEPVPGRAKDTGEIVKYK
jgi:hypothetical protein